MIIIGQIGYFGSERFEVSDKKVFTPNNIQRSSSARFESFNRIGLKPLTEYVAPGLATFTLTIQVSAMLGVNPRTVLDHWIGLVDAGNPDVLVIGNKVVGTDLWVLKTAADTWKQLDGQGNILTAEINLSFEEYMSQ